ncbi:MAG: hypothetical protein J3K34DRAFT_517435 [Monoraphidium minutum]|nr:MAG: hypothetical protein J3K34DRAFT_517435 [Monoraphidium minutum]
MRGLLAARFGPSVARRAPCCAGALSQAPQRRAAALLAAAAGGGAGGRGAGRGAAGAPPPPRPPASAPPPRQQHGAPPAGEGAGGAGGGPPPVVVVGAGAAGLTAAYFAARAGAQVVCLERTREAGKKILMSGGTRCNVLPLAADVEADFFTESSRSALRAAFASWTLDGCREWLEHDVGLSLQLEEETAKWFPASNSSRDVRDALVAACRRAGVQFRYESSLEGLEQCGDESSGGGSGGGGGGEASAAAAEGGGVPGADDVSSGGGGGGGEPPAGSGGKRKRKGGGAAAARPPRREWLCRLAGGRSLRAGCVVLATGGLSFPAVGTDGTGHRILQSLGHGLAPPYAALTPLLGTHPGGTPLAGLSLQSVRLSAHRRAAGGAAGGGGGKGAPLAVARRGGFLFTHKGYSGPAVLDVSHHAVMAQERGGPRPGALRWGCSGPAALDVSHHAVMAQERGGPRPVIRANWTGEEAAAWEERLQGGGAALVSTILQRGGVRERLAAALCASLGLTGRAAAQVRREERAALVEALTAYPLGVSGHEGYKKAEVTGGGVPLNQINVRTGESSLLPGLFLCGEVLDVFGRIGGFNFYWAWLSGRAAGRAAFAPWRRLRRRRRPQPYGGNRVFAAAARV